MTTFRTQFFIVLFSIFLALFAGVGARAGESQLEPVAPVIAQATEVVEHASVVRLILQTNRKLTEHQAIVISEAIHDAAAEFSLDPLLLVALASVESKFNAKAVYGASLGMFQVIPRYHKEKVAEGRRRWRTNDLCNVRFNAWLGAKILSEYMASTHTMRAALSRYNGTTSNGYSEKVLRLYRASKRSRL